MTYLWIPFSLDNVIKFAEGLFMCLLYRVSTDTNNLPLKRYKNVLWSHVRLLIRLPAITHFEFFLYYFTHAQLRIHS